MVYTTHTCDQHVTFPFPIICEPSNVEFPWLEKGYGVWDMGPLGNAKVKERVQLSS